MDERTGFCVQFLRFISDDIEGGKERELQLVWERFVSLLMEECRRDEGKEEQERKLRREAEGELQGKNGIK